MGKTIPNYEIKDDGETVTMILNVEEESSAKEIDLDFSDTTLLLNSKNYELTYNFQNKNGFKVDPNSVQAKFNKKQKSLALTFTKVVWIKIVLNFKDIHNSQVKRFNYLITYFSEFKVLHHVLSETTTAIEPDIVGVLKFFKFDYI